MANDNLEQIKTAYASKVLGVRNYKHDKQRFYIDDFLDLKVLADFFTEVDTGESDITPAGKTFLATYYDLGELAEKLYDIGFYPDTSRDKSPKEKIAVCTQWLQVVEPLVIARFIEEARGNITPDASMNENLLSPKTL